MISHCTYLLPIRRVSVSMTDLADFASYFQRLAEAGCDVLVVDGSPPTVFAENDRVWSGLCRHVTVDPQYPYLNGKVNGIHTGVALTDCERIITGDDDIRYTAENVAQMVALLDRYELVRPQNYFSSLPWWGKIEAVRMLLNRGILPTGDYPGTCGFRRSTMLRVGHYDGDVLFDNEEMVRHFTVKGARVGYATDFFIQKLPPTLQKWWEQRPRQAYEDFVMRSKTVLFLALLPVGVLLGWRWGIQAALAYGLAVAIASILIAWKGHRGAEAFFPVSLCFFALLWVLERSLSVYWAVYWWLVYRGYPFGDKLITKGTGRDWVAGRMSTPTSWFKAWKLQFWRSPTMSSAPNQDSN
jgi:hypothetical protein